MTIGAFLICWLIMGVLVSALAVVVHIWTEKVTTVKDVAIAFMWVAVWPALFITLLWEGISLLGKVVLFDNRK